MKDSRKTLVLGVGNLLMGDEGVGVHAAQRLQLESLPPNVEVLDGGTGGFHLLSYFHDYDPIILIDATMDGKPLGTVTVTTPKYSSDFPRSLSAHDIGLRDLIECAELTRGLPNIYLITVSIETLQTGRTTLSELIQESLPKIVEKVEGILSSEKELAEQ